MSDDVQELITARDLGRRRDDDGWLMRDVELTLGGGDRVAVVGPTGSGKSVLLRALGCLDVIDQGDLCWQGRAIADAEVPHYRAQAIYLHQRAAMFDGTVADNLRLPFSLRVHQDKQFDRDWAVAQLALLQRLATFLEKDVRDLSGGEAQIVALSGRDDLSALDRQKIAKRISGLASRRSRVETQLQIEAWIADWQTAAGGDHAV
jgi:putative ABC transport system ATP-binding protein